MCIYIYIYVYIYIYIYVFCAPSTLKRAHLAMEGSPTAVRSRSSVLERTWSRTRGLDHTTALERAFGQN